MKNLRGSEYFPYPLYIALLLCIAIHPKRFTIMWGGLSSTTTSVQHPLGWCDGSHRAHHTPATGGEEREIEPIKWMGIIRRPWLTRASGGKLARTPGVTPLLFTRSAMGFLMTTESQDLGLTSHPKDGAFYSIVSPSLYWGVRTHTDHRVSTPAGLTNTSTNSNLVFPGGLPSRYWPAQPCLASVGNQSWAAGWYGCGTVYFYIIM